MRVPRTSALLLVVLVSLALWREIYEWGTAALGFLGW